MHKVMEDVVTAELTQVREGYKHMIHFEDIMAAGSSELAQSNYEAASKQEKAEKVLDDLLASLEEVAIEQ